MLIETLDKSYTVIRCCQVSEDYERYICSDESRRNYTIIRIKNRSHIEQVMEFFVGEKENKKFSDFKDCFVTQDGLHLVFVYKDGETLEEKLKSEGCSLEERLELFQRILERMLLLEMPDYIQQDCLTASRIVVNKALEVDFQYELEDITNYGQYHFDSVLERLCRLYDLLFARELEKRFVLPLNQFRTVLRHGKLDGRMEIYRGYMQLREEISGMSPEDMALPKTWPFLLWNRMKRLFGPLKRIVVTVLFVVALLYLIFTIRQTGKPDETQTVFTHIGTLEVGE